MELIVIAVVMLVLLTAVDAGLWPKTAPHRRPTWTVRRMPPRSIPRRTARRSASAGHVGRSWAVAPKPAASAARWWWE